jgi:ankyrin repeat protein
LSDTDDSTPLHVSVQFGNLEATKALFERGASINNTNKHGVTPLMLGAYNGKLEMFHYLTDIGTNSITVLYLAISIRDLQSTLFFTWFHPRILWVISSEG